MVRVDGLDRERRDRGQRTRDHPQPRASLIDSERQWFKSRVGLHASETPRQHAFCAHAIQDPEQVMVVADAARDPRFAVNPLVTGAPNIRFYAGAPLLSSAGHALGALCVIDHKAREADPKKLDTLRFLAAELIRRMETRRAAPRSGEGPSITR
jgi:GAF domain-containing protein